MPDVIRFLLRVTRLLQSLGDELDSDSGLDLALLQPCF